METVSPYFIYFFQYIFISRCFFQHCKWTPLDRRCTHLQFACFELLYSCSGRGCKQHNQMLCNQMETYFSQIEKSGYHSSFSFCPRAAFNFFFPFQFPTRVVYSFFSFTNAGHLEIRQLINKTDYCAGVNQVVQVPKPSWTRRSISFSPLMNFTGQF